MDDQQSVNLATEVAMTAQSNVGSRDATQGDTVIATARWVSITSTKGIRHGR